MPDEIKAGDVVQLKSGGPTMTVSWVSDEYGTLTAGCTWFVKDKKEFERFPVTSLQRV
jgi:uncharacterized protein YodC (DUF2158 family)